MLGRARSAEGGRNDVVGSSGQGRRAAVPARGKHDAARSERVELGENLLEILRPRPRHIAQHHEQAFATIQFPGAALEGFVEARIVSQQGARAEASRADSSRTARSAASSSSGSSSTSTSSRPMPFMM